MPANGNSGAVSGWVWWITGYQEWHLIVSEIMPWAAWKPFLAGEHQTSCALCRTGWRDFAGAREELAWPGLDGEHFSVFPKSSQTPAHCAEAWCGPMTSLIRLGSWEPWSHRCYRQGRWALVLLLCFGACHWAAVTLPMVLPDPEAGALAPLQPILLWLCVLAIQADWEVAKVNAGEGGTKKGVCYPGTELRQRCLWHWWENTPMAIPSASCKHVLSLLGLTVSWSDLDISWAWLYSPHFFILRGTLAQMSAATRNRQKLLCSKDVLCPRFILRTKGTAYNSAPGFSEFNLVSTFLRFLTLYTRLLHTNQKPNGSF